MTNFLWRATIFFCVVTLPQIIILYYYLGLYKHEKYCDSPYIKCNTHTHIVFIHILFIFRSNKWSLLIGRHDLLDGKINSQRVCSDHFDKSSITSPTAGTNVRLISGAMPMKVYQTDECNKVSLDKSSVIIEKCSTPVNNKEPCTWISTSSTQSPSQTSAQISQLICTDTSSKHKR